jgi:long-chain fatty acid transport protein
VLNVMPTRLMGDVLKKLILSAAFLASTTAIAFAGGFAVREQSTEAQGTSFAGVAAGTEGLSAMFWNPATLSNNNDKGLISEMNSALIMPDISADNGVGSPRLGGSARSGNIGKLALVPSSYWSYGVSEDLTLGVSLNAPFGSVTDAKTWTGSPHGDKSKVVTYNLNPAAAYRIGDMLTLGAGVQVEFMKVNINSRLPNGTEIFKTKGDDIGIGFTAGVLFEPAAGTDIGIGFRSSVKHKLEGEGFRLSPDFPRGGDISADFSSPEMVTFGISQAVTDDFRLKAGVEWANWSRFKELRIKNAATGGTVALTPEDWKDSWFFSVGGEYDLNDALTLRAGLGYEKSPVPDATRTPRLPDNDRLWLSAGGSYQITDSMRASLAFTHIRVDDAPIALAAVPPPGVPVPLTATFKGYTNIVSFALTRDW